MYARARKRKREAWSPTHRDVHLCGGKRPAAAVEGVGGGLPLGHARSERFEVDPLVRNACRHSGRPRNPDRPRMALSGRTAEPSARILRQMEGRGGL